MARGRDDDILADELGKINPGGRLGARLIGNDTYEISLVLAMPFATAVDHCTATLQRLGNLLDDGEVAETSASIRAVLGSGVWNLNPAVVTIELSRADDSSTAALIRGIAKEGLIKQRAGQKAAERVAAAL